MQEMSLNRTCHCSRWCFPNRQRLMGNEGGSVASGSLQIEPSSFRFSISCRPLPRSSEHSLVFFLLRGTSPLYPQSVQYNVPPISLSSLFLPCFLDPTRSPPLLSSFPQSHFSAACLPSRPPPSIFLSISGLALSPLQRSVLHHSPSTPSTFSFL